MKPLILIQARMGSSRLPGKVLKTLAGKPQLQHLFDRFGKYTKEGNVTVVTSTEKGDDEIEEYCAKQGVGCFRGSEQDVLDRYYQASKKFCGTTIIRVTADCPLHHEAVISFALNEFNSQELDYFSNSFAPDYEDGCDTEVFSFAALEQAWKEADLQSQREHVTPYIKDSGKFKCGFRKFDAGYKYKLSVDTIQDHESVENIFRAFAPRTDFGIHEIVQLLKKDPSIIDANKTSVINEGYARSLREDKKIK